MAAPGLSMVEREEIRAGIARGDGDQKIADLIHRHRTTVSREIARNGGRRWYRAFYADRRARKQRRRPKICKIIREPKLAARVRTELRAGYSPMATAMRLRKECGLTISHETIYRSLYTKELRPLVGLPREVLRTRRRFRRSHNTRKPARNVLRQFKLVNSRPPIVDMRTEPGHWEGDLIVGERNHSQLVTLVERTSRFTIVLPLPSRVMGNLNRAIEPVFKTLPPHMRRTITWDQGSEMAGWKWIESNLGMSVYFCKAASPWQRPSNENTNRHLRFWFPKSTDLRQVTNAHITKAMNVWNSQPRRVLNWKSSAEVYAAQLVR